ncbi:MAG: AI-2E family transporter, partial [Bacillota bacterium]
MSDVSPRVKRLVWHTGALLLTTATLVVLYYVGRFLLPVLLPFLLALLISLFIEPLVRLLERRAKFPRGLAVLASIFFIIAVVGFAVALGTAQLVNELIILSRTSADSIRALQGTIENLV